MLEGPFHDRFEHWEDVPALRGQVVGIAHRFFLVGFLFEQLRLLHAPQPVGENVGGDTLRGIREFLVESFPEEQHVPDHQQGPFVAEQVEHVGDGAIGTLFCWVFRAASHFFHDDGQFITLHIFKLAK